MPRERVGAAKRHNSKRRRRFPRLASQPLKHLMHGAVSTASEDGIRRFGGLASQTSGGSRPRRRQDFSAMPFAAQSIRYAMHNCLALQAVTSGSRIVEEDAMPGIILRRGSLAATPIRRGEQSAIDSYDTHGVLLGNAARILLRLPSQAAG